MPTMLQDNLIGMLYVKHCIHNVATTLWSSSNCNLQGALQFAGEKRLSFYCILSYVSVILFNYFYQNSFIMYPESGDTVRFQNFMNY